MRISAFVTVVAWILASVSVSAPIFAESPDPELNRYVGTWETTYPEDEGTGRQIWELGWNEKSTFLDLRTMTYVNGELAYVGTGFVFHSRPDSEYRMYLMMDNGALHESIGERTGEGEFRFTTKTIGVPNFPEMQTLVSLGPGEMKVTYLWTGKDGVSKSDENLFKLVRD